MPGPCCLAPGHSMRALKPTPGSKQEAKGAKPLAAAPRTLRKQPLENIAAPMGLGTKCAESFQEAKPQGATPGLHTRKPER